MRIRSHLAILIAGALLPVVLFALVLTTVFWSAQRAAYSQHFVDRAHAMAVALDVKLESATRQLEELALSPELDAGDLPGFYERAKAAMATQSSWSTVILADTHAKPLLDLRLPLGDDLGILPENEAFWRAVSTRRPAVSALTGDSPNHYATFAMVPVVREDKVLFVLMARIEPAAWLTFVSRYPVSSDATITLEDQQGIVIARTLNPERWVGKSVALGLLEKSRESPEAGYQSKGLEGQWFYTAHSRSTISGWTVALGVPASAVDADLWESTAIIGASVVLVAILTILTVNHFGGQITTPIATLLRSVKGLVSDDDVEVGQPQGVNEIIEVAAAFEHGRALLRERQHALENALQRERAARQEAEAASRARDIFVAMLGHELRNPLGALSNAVAVLNHTGFETEPGVRSREIIQRQIGQLKRLVDDLLDVARVATGKIVLSVKPLELGQIARRTVEVMSEARGIVDPNIDIEASEVWVLADERRIEQVLVNLLDNAIKYTPAGGRIALSVKKSDATAAIEIRDTGIGIRPELLPHVFDLFTQEEQTLDRSQGGLGLGLAIVRRIVELHRGTVEATSVGVGEGSVFTVRLPAVDPPINPAEPDHSSGYNAMT